MYSISPAIHVCPIKQLYHIMEEGAMPDQAAGILCTLNGIMAQKLGQVPFLHLEFADVPDEASPRAFSPEQAQKIRSFVDAHAGSAHLFFCCDSGESRSTALAAATMHYFGQNEMAIWKNVRYHPNPLVYYLQSRAYGLDITREDAMELYKYNQQLFRRQIRIARETGQ